MTDTLEALFDRRPRKIERAPTTATVARIDREGTWVSVPGADPRQPLGPCRGGAHVAAGGEGELVPEDSPLVVGMNVLLVWTDDGPWIAGMERY